MKPQIKTIAASVALACAATSAQAVLERTGPLNDWGFPSWYQDGTGIALEYCNITSQVELDGGHCLLLPGDTTLARDTEPGVEETANGTYFDEHFWWAGEASMDANGARALLVLAAEAAFAADPAPGGQIAFTRIRVRLDPVPVTGEYRFIHPYGEEVAYAEAGERIFITDDVGINCPPGEFHCAGEGRVGPFLLASDTPGGAELPPVGGGAPGKLYIASPDRLGPVTGSPTGNNKFRIVGPEGSNLDGQGNNFIETTDFALMGRVFSGVMPGRVSDVRANYADKDVSGKKVDVFLTAEPTAQARVPGGVQPPAVRPTTSFYDKPCQPIVDAAGNVTGLTAPAGSIERLMKDYQNHRWGQVLPAGGTLPASVCVKDNTGVDLNGNTVPSYQEVAVRDEVTISKAFYDPSTGNLTVEANSSDEKDLTLQLTLQAFGNSYPLTNGAVTVTGVTAPPESVLVQSSRKGSASQRIDTGIDSGSGGGGATAPVAENILATTNEDTVVPITVPGYDTSLTVSIVANPGFGSAVANGGQIDYTPLPNANGADVFSYVLTDATGVSSNIGTVTVNVTPQNDAPAAANDAAVGNAGAAILISPLVNDTDVDGDALHLGATTGAISGPEGAVAEAVVNSATGTITFTADLAGIYTFTYDALDPSGASSTGTVTVTTSPADSLTIDSAELRTGKNRWKIAGTSQVSAPHEVSLYMTNCGVGRPDVLIGTALSDLGAYALDTTAAPNISTCSGNSTQVKAVSSLGGLPVTFTPRIRN